MERYRIDIEYDGTPYIGWQRQTGHPSVQQAIEQTIKSFCLHEVTLFGAGRTDAGVHAFGQVAHFDMEKHWAPEKLFEAINGILSQRGERISVTGVEPVSQEFHSRFSAKKRHYRYRIINRKAPLSLERHRAWWVRFSLDEKIMHEAAQMLVGHHDFTTFRSVKCQAKSPLKTLEKLAVQRQGDEIEITASSRSFLHNQVRSIVGTLKAVGDGKWSGQDVVDALEAKDHKRCAALAPPWGLYLERVDY